MDGIFTGDGCLQAVIYFPNCSCAAAIEIDVMVEKFTPERLSHEFSLGPDAPQVVFNPSPTHI
jgi:hypothetical protein